MAWLSVAHGPHQTGRPHRPELMLISIDKPMMECVCVWQLTISVWGKDEEVIDKPMSPNDIKRILYDRCFPFDPIQTVLQQELIINIGTFITTNPEYFRGILKIRIG